MLCVCLRGTHLIDSAPAGILNVAAVDKGSGKSEKITITNDKGERFVGADVVLPLHRVTQGQGQLHSHVPGCRASCFAALAPTPGLSQEETRSHLCCPSLNQSSACLPSYPCRPPVPGGD